MTNTATLSNTLTPEKLEELRQLAFHSEWEKAMKQRQKRERRRFFAMKFKTQGKSK